MRGRRVFVRYSPLSDIVKRLCRCWGSFAHFWINVVISCVDFYHGMKVIGAARYAADRSNPWSPHHFYSPDPRISHNNKGPT